MSDVKVEGYKVSSSFVPLPQSQTYLLFSQTSEILAALAAVFEGYNADEKAAQLKKVRPRSTHVLLLNCVAHLASRRTTASLSSVSRTRLGRRRGGPST